MAALLRTVSRKAKVIWLVQISLTLGEKLPNIKKVQHQRELEGWKGGGMYRKLTPLFMETLLLLNRNRKL